MLLRLTLGIIFLSAALALGLLAWAVGQFVEQPTQDRSQAFGGGR